MELPKLTVELRRKMDAAAESKGDYKAMHDFLKEVYPADYLSDSLGGASLKEVDTVALEKLFIDTRSEYERPVREAQERALAESLSMFDSIDFEKVNRAMDALNRQVFANVR